jgi:uncharacterized protein YjcR
MNLTKKSQAIIDDEADRAIAELTSILCELDARGRAVMETIIVVEPTVSAAQFDITADTAQAEALLERKKFVASREKPITQLAALRAEHKAIAQAAKIGGSRLHLLTTARSAKIWVAHFSEIAEIEKRRMMLVFEIQRTNRERERLRTKIEKAGGAGFLSTDGVEFLGFGDEYAEIQWAAKRLVADGICTNAEIERARSDG